MEEIDIEAERRRENLRERANAEDKNEDAKEKDIQKVYIKNYGNLVLEIVGSNDIGMLCRSEKRKENLFIPWTSIIMCSKIDDE